MNIVSACPFLRYDSNDVIKETNFMDVETCLRTKKTTLILAAIVVIAVAVGAWLFLNNKGNNDSQASNGAQVSTDGGTKSMSQTFYIYDTVVTIKIFGDTVAQKNMDDIQHMLEKMDIELSRTKEGGEVYAVNQAAGKEAVVVSDDTLDAVKQSLKYAQEMDGLFDPTIGPLVDLWNIGSGGDHIPPQADIDKAKALTNYKDVIIDEAAKTIKLANEGMVLDLAESAKGMPPTV
ncbi:FAD:protein FMN transferase [Paenibacillus sp. BR2-3]